MGGYNSTTLKHLSSNFISLVVLQGVNYLVPLIIFPYLVHVLGIDGFGLYSFVLAVIMYGVTISDYGFDLSATKMISIYRDDKGKVDEIFSSVLIIKFTLALIYLFFMFLLTVSVDKFMENSIFYYIGFGIIFGYILFPTWFFQGIEKMRYITIINAVSKLIFTVLILIFVHSPQDIVLVFIFNALGSIVAGVIALYIAIKTFNVKLKIPEFKIIYFYLVDGWYIFTSRVIVEFYITANTIILGMFASNTIVGYYSIVSKITQAIGSMLEPLTRTVFPYLARVYQESEELFYKRNIQLAVLILIVMMPVAFIVYFHATWILTLISGNEPSLLMIELLEMFSIVLVFYLYGHLFTNMLVTLKETKLLNNIVMIAGGMNIVFVPFVISFSGVVGLVWFNIFIALFIAVSKGYYSFVKSSFYLTTVDKKNGYHS